MEQYISKSDLVEEIKNRIKKIPKDETDERFKAIYGNEAFVLTNLLSFIDTLDVKDPYEQCVQYDSIKTGIQAHAETYSFNIESLLFNQLTKEQQELWRKEIEQAVISGGEAGVELARDPRYKENIEVKEVREEPVDEDLEEAANDYAHDLVHDDVFETFKAGAQWQALHSLETIKGMEEQAFLAGVEAEQINKSFSKEELLNKWKKVFL